MTEPADEVSRVAAELDAKLPNLPPESEIATAIGNEFRAWLQANQQNFPRWGFATTMQATVETVADILRRHGAR